jgi:signal transduction histidine kinase
MKIPLCSKLFVTFLFVLSCSNSRQIPPKAVKGLLDLNNWELAKDGILKLDGEWEFYPFVLQDEAGELPGERKHFIDVPKKWNGFIYKDINGETREMTGVGYGTYRLKILTSLSQVSLKSPTQGTAFSLFCGKEKKLESGIIGTTKDTSLPSRKIPNPIICEISQGELILTLTISNFHNFTGGQWLSLLLGTPQEILEKRERNLSLDLFLAGTLFIMGLYHISLYSLRREDRSAIFFGAFCLLISLRTLLTGENYLYNLSPGISYELGIKLEYLTMYLGIPIFNEYLSSIYPLEVNSFIRKFIHWVCIPLSIFVILFSSFYFTSTLPAVQIVLLIAILSTIYILIRAIRNHRLGAKTFIFGFSFFSIVITNDILYSNQLINTGMYFPLGFVVFILSQSFLLSSRFANAFRQVYDLTHNLEKKVEDRTRTLEEATQTLLLANHEISDSREQAEKALQKSKKLTEMMEVIIQSTSTDDLFQKIYELLHKNFNLNSYLLYLLDKEKGELSYHRLYGYGNIEESSLAVLHKNVYKLSDNSSIHSKCVLLKKSFFGKNIRTPHPNKQEEEMILSIDVKSFYIIPMIMDNEVIGTIDFANTKYENSNIKGLTKSDRVEIENFVRLISPSIYQSLQKNLIEKAFSELSKTKSELESQKAQMERLHAMSLEIQEKTNYKDMLQTLENILWKSYQIGDYILVVHNPVSEEFELVNVSQQWLFHSLDKIIKNIPLSENKSVHKLVFVKKRSLFLPKFKDISNGESEDYNRNLLGMESIFAIPCIVNNESFAVLSFSDVKSEYTKDPMLRGVKRLTHKQRDEIEQLVSLIANPLYQSLQKAQIEKAYSELQETQAQLVEAERLASLGQLVGGIAHEINNPIAVIRSQSELLTNSIHSTLNEIPHFLESLSTTEKGLFYDIVNHSIKNTESFSTKQERAKKKEIQKDLDEVLEGSDEEVSFLTEQILLLHLQTPYDRYVKELGVVRFKEFLSNAMIFKNQTNSLSNIEIAVEKASRVVFALRSYLNTDLSLVKKEVNLMDELEKSLHVYDNYVMGKINVRKDFPSELKYTCVPENLSQVWKNLFFNAIQAMYTTEKKLTILIEKKEKLPDELKTYRTSSIVEDSLFQARDVSEWILVSITDSGTGIMDDLQQKVFTPFFTTKSLGEGIGLGLYVCKKIVHDHGGALFFKSEEGTTEFVVVLPIN